MVVPTVFSLSITSRRMGMGKELTGSAANHEGDQSGTLVNLYLLLQLVYIHPEMLVHRDRSVYHLEVLLTAITVSEVRVSAPDTSSLPWGSKRGP